MKKILILAVTVLLFACNANSDLDKGLYAKFSTDKGDITAMLNYEEVPITVLNFVGLAKGKFSAANKEGPFYDGLTFYNVIPEFMVLSGDPAGDGTGGPGYTFPDEMSADLNFEEAGKLAMANLGSGENGSQFFITHVPAPWLNGKFPVFGTVVQGLDVVSTIVQDDVIKTVKIIAKGKAAKDFVKTANQETFDSLIAEKATAIDEENARIAAEVLADHPDFVELTDGVYYKQTKAGNGELPKQGDVLAVDYVGKLLDDTVFDSSIERGEPIAFPVQTGQVIPGWDYMLSQMKEGEKGTVLLAPDMAYGARGAGPVIPPNAWLIFDLEFVENRTP